MKARARSIARSFTAVSTKEWARNVTMKCTARAMEDARARGWIRGWRMWADGEFACTLERLGVGLGSCDELLCPFE